MDGTVKEKAVKVQVDCGVGIDQVFCLQHFRFEVPIKCLSRDDDYVVICEYKAEIRGQRLG